MCRSRLVSNRIGVVASWAILSPVWVFVVRPLPFLWRSPLLTRHAQLLAALKADGQPIALFAYVFIPLYLLSMAVLAFAVLLSIHLVQSFHRRYQKAWVMQESAGYR
jgi:hypothetical protein